MPDCGLELERAGQGFTAEALDGAGGWGRGASGSAGSGLGISDCPAHAGLAGKKRVASNSARPANPGARNVHRLPARPSL